jgi:hypothetical protein
MSDTFDGAKNEPINTAQYLKYLKVISELGRMTKKTPAEVDMALFSFSDTIMSFQQRVKSWEKEAAGRMWAYDQLAPMGAAFFEAMHAAYLNGDPQVMYRLVASAVSKKARIGKIIEMQELVNFELLKDDLDRIKEELLDRHIA